MSIYFCLIKYCLLFLLFLIYITCSYSISLQSFHNFIPLAILLPQFYFFFTILHSLFYFFTTLFSPFYFLYNLVFTILFPCNILLPPFYFSPQSYILYFIFCNPTLLHSLFYFLQYYIHIFNSL